MATAMKTQSQWFDPDATEYSEKALLNIEKPLSEVERLILQYHGGMMGRWSEEQQNALRNSAQMDEYVLRWQGGLSMDCLRGIESDLESYRSQRAEARSTAQESIENAEEHFADELATLGKEHLSEANKIIDKVTSKIRASSEAMEEKEWAKFDSSLRAILWQHAKMIRGNSVIEGAAELYDSGELAKHLEDEKQQWALMQRNDLENIQGEIKAHQDAIFDKLQDKLRELSPQIILNANQQAALQEMAASERRRLAEIDTELRNNYEAEVAAIQAQSDKDYRQYDCELQSILMRTLEERFKNAAQMRQLKLALCRWRLDYQKLYHEYVGRLTETASGETAKEAAERGKPKPAHLDAVRNLVANLWARNRVPASEMKKFLARASDAAASCGMAQPLLKVYEDELEQYGALPLLEHANRPELLECWLQALQREGRASLRGASGTGATSFPPSPTAAASLTVSTPVAAASPSRKSATPASVASPPVSATPATAAPTANKPAIDAAAAAPPADTPAIDDEGDAEK